MLFGKSAPRRDLAQRERFARRVGRRTAGEDVDDRLHEIRIAPRRLLWLVWLVSHTGTSVFQESARFERNSLSTNVSLSAT